MKSRTLWIAVIILLVVVGGAYFLMKEEAQAPVTCPGCDDTNLEQSTGATTSNEQAAAKGQMSINIYVVEFEASADPDIGNKIIGCGDAVHPIARRVPQTQGVLRAALEELFKIKDKDIKGGDWTYAPTYYNALYQSDLKVDSATITNGVATVKLSGTTALGGECDTPRVIEQIKQTVMQFPTIKSANIFINNKSLEEYFSLK